MKRILIYRRIIMKQTLSYKYKQLKEQVPVSRIQIKFGKNIRLTVLAFSICMAFNASVNVAIADELTGRYIAGTEGSSETGDNGRNGGVGIGANDGNNGKGQTGHSGYIVSSNDLTLTTSSIIGGSGGKGTGGKGGSMYVAGNAADGGDGRGGNGGYGVNFSGTGLVHINAHSRITGGAGGSGTGGKAGTAGGIGSDGDGGEGTGGDGNTGLEHDAWNSSIFNEGMIIGGDGGRGKGGSDGNGNKGAGGNATGGDGGTGIRTGSGFEVINSSSATIAGGDGGRATGHKGGDGASGDRGGSASAGRGGHGMLMSYATLKNSGNVRGGNGGHALGGDSGSGTFSRSSGNASGGGGGVALYIVLGNASLENEATGVITGGNGGKGEAGSGQYALVNVTDGSFGRGGRGSEGVHIDTGGKVTLNNAGKIQGGNGGNGYGGGVNSGITFGEQGAGAGGNGGFGVYIDNTSIGGLVPTVLINNTGTIIGGKGGTGKGGSGSANGSGAEAIHARNGYTTVINAGTITSGGSGVPAIHLGGWYNTLELHKGSVINGVVFANHNKNNMLVLGGREDDIFNVSEADPASSSYKYRGFDFFEKIGESTWTLTNTTARTTPWTLRAGKLSISQDAALGDTNTTLSLAGGTLQVTDNITTTRQVQLTDQGGLEITANKSLVLNKGITENSSSSLIKTGAGNLTLAQNNTNTGQTQIQDGTLQLTGIGSIAASKGIEVATDGTFGIMGITGASSNIVRLSGSGRVELGSKNLTLTGSADSSFSGVVAGLNGSLTKQGNGALILSGIHTYTGKTDIQAGKLHLGETLNTTQLDSSLIDLHNNTTLKLNGKVEIVSGDVKFGNNTKFDIANASNAPALIAKGLDLTGNNIQFNLSGISDKSIANQVLLQTSDGITGDFKTIAVGGFAGEVDYLTLQTNKSNNGKEYLASYNLSWAANNNTMHGTFTLTNASDMFTVDAVLSDETNLHNNTAAWDGKSLTKKGVGTLILNATNTYTGMTDVQEGSLIVGGSPGYPRAQIAGNVNVQNGATIGGHGTIQGRVNLLNGSILSPGSSIGQLTVGDINFGNGSISIFELNPDGTGDKVIVQSGLGVPPSLGIAVINPGAILEITNGGGSGTWGVNQYTLVTADGGVTGQFDTVRNHLAFLDPFLTKDPNNIFLQLVRNNVSFLAIGNTYNQRNTGQVLEAMGTSNRLYQLIVGMNANQAQNAFDSFSGEIHASIKSAAFTNSRYVRSAVNQHLDGNLADQLDSEKSLWINPWYHSGHLKDDGNAAKLNNKGSGFLVGLDAYSTEKTTLGFALGYEQNSLDIGSTRNSEADTDAIHLIVYGRNDVGAAEIKGGLGYSWLDVDSKRTISVGNLFAKNEASYNGKLFQVFVEGSHAFNYNDKDSITPYVRLAYQKVKFGDFIETGSEITKLYNNSRSDSMTVSTIGARGNWMLGEKSSLYADLGWQRGFGNSAPESILNFANGQNYKIKGVEIDRNAAVIGLGGNLQLKSNMSLSIGYEGHLGNKSRDHGAKMLWELKFR